MIFPFGCLFIISITMCVGILKIVRHTGFFAGRKSDLKSIQTAHAKRTPRMGGVAIFASLAASILFIPSHLHAPYTKFLFATSILFAAGLAEDFGWNISPKVRLITATIASLTVVILLNTWVDRTGWPFLDTLMRNGTIGIPLTIFVVVGISNSFNLIDGVHGLSAFTGLITCIALAAIATASNNDQIFLLVMLLAASISGFLMINYPFGLIFLGDAGAYTLGFVLAWLGISIISENTEVTPWAILLTMFWPIADTMLAIYRRGIQQRSTIQPDRLHVHQLVMRYIEIFWLGRNRRQISNPLTTAILLPFITFPAILGIMFWNEPLYAFFSFWGVLFMFFLTYFLLLAVARSGYLRRTSPD